MNIRMKGKKINFNDNKIKKSDFYNKDKKYLMQMILMLVKYQSLKKKHMVNTINLNTLLGIMIMMLLDHYIYLFHKRLATLINLIKIK